MAPIQQETAIQIAEVDSRNQNYQREESLPRLQAHEPNLATTNPQGINLNTEDVYSTLQLGFFQSLVFALSKNKRLSVHVAILINILLSILDVVFDFILFFQLVYQDCDICRTMAILIAVSDYLPGAMLLAHDSTSSNWSRRSKLDKGIFVFLLIIQPFSVVLTNILWIFNINSRHHHYRARLTGIFAGTIESPLQFIAVTFLWSKGVLALPWQQTTAIIDNNDNYLYMGNIGLTSLVFTTVGLLKAAIDIFEAPEEKPKVVLFTCTNMLFRLLSFCFVSQFFQKWAIPMFLLLLLANLVVFLRRSEHQRTRIVTVTSAICSLIVPVTLPEEPHESQIVKEQAEQNIPQKREQFREVKMNSFWLAVITTPIILVMDVMVVITLSFAEYKHDSIWSDALLKNWVYAFFLVLFVLTMVSAWTLHPGKSHTMKQANDQTLSGCNVIETIEQILKELKQFMAQISILSFIGVGVIITVTLHSVYTPQLNTVILGYTNIEKELIISEATSLDYMNSKCFTENKYVTCAYDLEFRFKDYRKIGELMDDIFYLDPEINGTEWRRRPLDAPYYYMETIPDWNTFAPPKLKEPKCKRCLTSSYRCRSFLHGIGHILDCNGMLPFKICLFVYSVFV